MSGKLLARWGGIIICAAVVVVMLVTMAQVRRASRHDREQLETVAAEYNAVMRPLWNEKSRLEQEIGELKEEKGRAEHVPATILFLCTEPDGRMIEDAYQLLSSYDYPALLILSEDKLPGDPDCLSIVQVKVLLGEGWELGVAVDADTDVAALCSRIEDLSLPKPTVAYFASGKCDAGQLALLKAQGIFTVIQYGLSADSLVQDDVWFLRAYGSRDSGAKNAFTDSAQSSSPLVLTVGYTRERDMFNLTTYGSMLRTVESYELAGNIYVKSASTAYEDIMSGVDPFREISRIYQERLHKLESELAEVNEAIRVAQVESAAASD